MEITDEMRAAVLAEQAQQCDHIYDLSQMTPSKVASSDGVARTYLAAAVPDQLPHIRCTGCGQTWLVIDEPGHGYDQAAGLLADRFGVATDDPRVLPRWTALGGLQRTDGAGRNHLDSDEAAGAADPES